MNASTCPPLRVNDITSEPMNGVLRNQRGSSLIQVLVAMLATAAGLLGLARLQYRTEVAELEHFQRKLANILVQDMASRIATNSADAPLYVTSSALGYGKSCPMSHANRLEQDRAEWCQALQGAGTDEPSARSRAILGARGCVQRLPHDEYMITVAWHGFSPSTSSNGGVACGEDRFEHEHAGCANDRCRRAVSTIVRVEPTAARALASNTIEESELVPDSAVTL